MERNGKEGESAADVAQVWLSTTHGLRNDE